MTDTTSKRNVQGQTLHVRGMCRVWILHVKGMYRGRTLQVREMYRGRKLDVRGMCRGLMIAITCERNVLETYRMISSSSYSQLVTSPLTHQNHQTSAS